MNFQRETKVDDWIFKGSFGVLLVVNAEERRERKKQIEKKTRKGEGDELDNVKMDGGGSGNSGGKRLVISMVEEAWLSEKEKV
nr:hypothetical protein [Tanacetum cinerariifolium]